MLLAFILIQIVLGILVFQKIKLKITICLVLEQLSKPLWGSINVLMGTSTFMAVSVGLDHSNYSLRLLLAESFEYVSICLATSTTTSLFKLLFVDNV